MFLQNKTSELLEVLRNGIEDEDFDSFLAYPYVKKPAKLSKSVIAVCLGGVDAKAVSLTGEGLIGDYIIEANIFSPWEKGSEEISRIAEKAVKAVLSLNPKGVGLSQIKADDALKCYRLKCSFTFNQRIWEG